MEVGEGKAMQTQPTDSNIPSSTETRWIVRGAILALLIIIGGGAYAYLRSISGPPTYAANSNSILIIAPYRYQGTWVFDDPEVGLKREPFVAGVPEMIDVLVKDVPNAKDGFRLLFSATAFPGYQQKLTWVKRDGEGNTYRMEDPPMEGWICPALFRYYQQPPKEIYVKAEAIKDD
jgi:hypothetical protein